MAKKIIPVNILFEVIDVLGKKVRITKLYWLRIKSEKHRELTYDYPEVVRTLEKSDEVYISVRDAYIRLFFKNFRDTTLVVLVKYLNGDGFIVTVYQTSKVKRKGEKVWPKQKSF